MKNNQNKRQNQQVKLWFFMLLFLLAAACSIRQSQEPTETKTEKAETTKQKAISDTDGIKTVINSKTEATTATTPDERRFINLSQLPKEGKSLTDFVPPGWKIEEQIEGDLNADATPDIVLQLIEDLPAETDGTVNDRYRALLVIAKMENDLYLRLAAADKLLFCTTCFGVLNGAPIVKISNGVIIINHLWGSREMSENTQRFRFDPKVKRFVLIGEDYEETDRAEGTSVSESSNYLTGVKIIEKFRLNAQGNEVKISSAKQRISKQQKFFEDIDYEKP